MADDQVNQDELSKNIIKSAVASGYQGYKAEGGTATNVAALINSVASSIMAMLDQRALSLDDASVQHKLAQQRRDLEAAQRTKNKLTDAHKMLAIRLGIWGKKDSTLPGEAWYIWVDRPPAWAGYLPQFKHHEIPATEGQFEGHVFSTMDENKALSLVSEEAAQECIDNFVHPYLRPYCKPTQRRE